MSELLFEVNGISSLGSVDGEDLTSKDLINTIPPPDEDGCDCCGRPLSELTPFDGPFIEGALLAEFVRRDAPYNEFVERINVEFFGNCSDFQKAKEKLVKKYGEEKAKYIINWDIISNSISSSRECRDCIVLDDYEFLERRIDSRDPPKRCECCGRHLGELKPFTEGDPVMDHFNGKLLARRNRPDAPPTEGVNTMMDTFFGNCITYEECNEALEKLFQKLGEEEAEKLWTVAFFLDPIFKSTWECKNCIVLDTHKYFEKKIAQESGSRHDSPG